MAQHDVNEIRRALALIVGQQVTELRAMKATSARQPRPSTVFGYFDNHERLAEEAVRISAPGIYFVPNPVDPACLARCANHVKVNVTEPTTSDRDILRRRWLLVDCDPVRPAGISSTEYQHTEALNRARAIRTELFRLGWQDPILADSGNGGHLLYAVDIPTQDEGLVAAVLDWLDLRFGGAEIQVDRTVFNPARIWKLYGTVAAKGENTEDRPHRLSRILEVPSEIQVTPSTLLSRVVRKIPRRPKLPRQQTEAIDAERWIHDHGLQASGPTNWKDGSRKWVFEVCPWDSQHVNRSAYLIQFSDGGLVAGCHHNGCRGRGWAELRDLYEKGWRERSKVERQKSERETAKHVLRIETRRALDAKPEPEPSPPPSTQPEPEPPPEQEAWPTNLTDLGNAGRLIRQHGEVLRYCTDWKGWMVWDGRRWARDRFEEIEALARQTVRALWKEATDCKHDPQLAEATAQWARKCESITRLRQMVSAAQTFRGVTVVQEQFDVQDWLLNLENGTMDLRTGKLGPHRKDDNLTMVSPVAHDPNAKCPTWGAFLWRVFDGDPDLVEFVQRCIGYSLVGATWEHVVLIMYGTGANGKSTFIEAVRHVLGDYARTADYSTFSTGNNDGSGAREDIARLRAARLVTCLEGDDQGRISETTLKKLTSDDMVVARALYEKSFEFRPRFKLFLATNHKPQIHGTDEGIWRRIRLLPFNVTIPPEERDRQLGDKLRAEAPGILNWALAGCTAWQERGLELPPSVLAATAAYREEMDVLGSFLQTECSIRGDWNPPPRVQASELYKRYKTWCEANEEEPIRQRTFGTRLAERGLPKRMIHGRVFYEGITLRTTSQGSFADDGQEVDDQCPL